MSYINQPSSRGIRCGSARHGEVRHIIDDWTSDIAAHRKIDIGLCGVEVEGRSEDSTLPICKRCEMVVRQMEKELRRRKHLPSEETVRRCLALIVDQPKPKLADVIPLRPRP